MGYLVLNIYRTETVPPYRQLTPLTIRLKVDDDLIHAIDSSHVSKCDILTAPDVQIRKSSGLIIPGETLNIDDIRGLKNGS